MLFSCHKVVENGLKREVICTTTSLVGESAHLNSFTGEKIAIFEGNYTLLTQNNTIATTVN